MRDFGLQAVDEPLVVRDVRLHGLQVLHDVRPISFARSAYFSVFTVCAYWSPPHDTFATIAVREFPLRACLSKRVSFELRNGT